MTIATIKPYKGPQSFELEDGYLFHGRDAEAQHLLSLVLSGTVTVLHAQSGAGKTSLLNARLLPGLETRGWTPVRIVPGSDPVESARTSLLATVLPTPAVEAAALSRARDALLAPDDDPSLNAFLQAFDALPPTDDRRARLTRSVALEEGREPSPAIFCRLLRAGLEVRSYDDHLAALCGAVGAEPRRVNGSTPISRLAEILADPRMTAGHRAIYDHLDIPALRLAPFVQRLLETYTPGGGPCRLVLLFDQFEEVFTRFGDPERVGAPRSARQTPAYGLRNELFGELIDLYHLSHSQPAGNGHRQDDVIPARYLISMRAEFIARLEDEIGPAIPLLLSERAFHLPLLSRKQADEAIRRPAETFGYRYTDDCFSTLITQLTKEGRWVEPAHLQIVCDKLWEEGGKRLAGSDSELPEDLLTAQGGTEGILASFFESFLDDLDASEVYEVLEMLGELVTGSGTRNIIEQRTLVKTPLRDAGLRRSLLKRLVDHTIVRVERRLGSEFVEITHEFLINPILDAVETRLAEDRSFADLQQARLSLDRLNRLNRGGTEQRLTWEELRLLHRLRERIRWNAATREAVFRGAIWLGADRQLLAEWVEELDKTSESRDIVAVLVEKEKSKTPLTRDELRAVQDHKDDIKLTPRRLEFLLKSYLKQATPNDRDDLVYWTKRMVSDAFDSDQHRA